ncbi:hypothetical protein OROMI_026787 [Orobanche minor]
MVPLSRRKEFLHTEKSPRNRSWHEFWFLKLGHLKKF